MKQEHVINSRVAFCISHVDAYGGAASEAWNETTRHCFACRTYTFVNRQSSVSSLALIWRVRCRRPLTTAVSSYIRMRMSEVA